MRKILLSVLFIAMGLMCRADEFYLVGDATPWGWVTGEARMPAQMTETDETGVYEWTGPLRHAEGFFICNSMSGWSGYGSSVPKADGDFPISDVGTDDFTETDNKWNPVNTDWQIFTITLNVNEGKVSWKAGAPFVPDDEGYYNIATASDLYWFSVIVSTNQSAKGRLTADIDYTGYPQGYIGTTGKSFNGTFDGQEHTITIAIENGSPRCTGLFAEVNGATIRNLVVEGSSTSAADNNVGGLGGRSNGSSLIENVIVKTAVSYTGEKDDASCGGIFADMEGAPTVKNCAFLGSIVAEYKVGNAGLVSWSGGGAQFSDCFVGIEDPDASEFDDYSRGNFTPTNCYRMDPTDEKIASGELCYMLNGDQSAINWYQTLDTDEYPVPFSTHSQVYANGELKCDGTSAGSDLVYSNSSTSIIPPHTDVGGWCSVCGKFISDHLTADENGFYPIASAEDLNWFAAVVEEINSAAKAKLTTDIDYTGYPNGFIGASTPFSGVFDGQEHTITIAIENGSVRCTGLFAEIKEATIRNLVVEGSSTSAADNNVGGLGGRSNGSSLIENVIVKTAVSYTGDKNDASCGGIFADMEGAPTVKNCAFLGSIVAKDKVGNAGLVSWSGGGAQFSNCFVEIVELDASEFDDYSRGNFTPANCYRMDPTDERIASGELCYMLNGDQSAINWYQTLDTDEYPVPFSTHSQVYANGELKCDGTSAGSVLVYSNSSTSIIPPHTDAGGWCSVCGNLIPDHLTADEDGFYPIASAEDLYWFAAVVKEINSAANAKLTADIDYTDYQNGFIGASTPFSGVFDGQEHTITVSLESDAKIRGLFAKINGATIKNLVVDGMIVSTSYNNIGGLGGQSDGNSSIENVVVKTSIFYLLDTGDSSVGGFFPYVNSGSLTFKNCAFYGTIEAGAATGNAGLVSWNSGSIEAENCLIAPVQIIADEFVDYARGNTPDATNCYRVEPTDERLGSGELCYLLNGRTSFNPCWTQTIGADEHPLPFATQGIVSHIASDGYGTLFVPSADVTIPEGVEAFACKIEDNKLKLTAIEGAISKDDAVILKGNQGYYSFVPTTDATPAAENELAAATADLSADGTQYILANGDEGIGFYKVKEGTTIPAGKVYLTVVDGTKSFYGFDDTTGIDKVQGTESASDGAVYNLAGQKILKMQKGINIMKGKKIFK